jgi:hypothetical protein
VVGDAYTILVSRAQTDGRYCMIDMLIPNAGRPPPQRHDFEEMFTLLETLLDALRLQAAQLRLHALRRRRSLILPDRKTVDVSRRVRIEC